MRHETNLLVIISVMFSLCCTNTAFAEDMFLRQTLFEGKSNIHEYNGHSYEIELAGVYDKVNTARVIMNGERSDFLKQDEEYKFADGSRILLREVFASDEGDDLAEYDFFPSGEGTTAIGETTADAEEEQETSTTSENPTSESAISESAQDTEATASQEQETETTGETETTDKSENGPQETTLTSPSAASQEKTAQASGDNPDTTQKAASQITQKEQEQSAIIRFWNWIKHFFV
jgi:hypothetical protein